MELFTQEQYKKVKRNELLLCQCDICNTQFYKTKNLIYHSRRHYSQKNNKINHTCSKKCHHILINKTKGILGDTKTMVICRFCNKEFLKRNYDIAKTKNNFCSHSCSASFSNKKQLIEKECHCCKSKYFLLPHIYKIKLKNKLSFCSNNCRLEWYQKNRKTKITNKLRISKSRKIYSFVCKGCGINFNKLYKDAKYCSGSCRSKNLKLYIHAHTKGKCSRSKIEVFLEENLTKLYKNIKFIFNDRVAIGQELDIHIPEFKLAFEINGIFHHEPIYGEKTLIRTQRRDKEKIELCIKNNIRLYIFDTYNKGFSKILGEEILNKIIFIINEKLNISKLVGQQGLEPYSEN
jgi:hypothetical protein